MDLMGVNGPKWPKRGLKRIKNAKEWAKAQGSPIDMHPYQILKAKNPLFPCVQQIPRERQREKRKREEEGEKGRKSDPSSVSLDSSSFSRLIKVNNLTLTPFNPMI